MKSINVYIDDPCVFDYADWSLLEDSFDITFLPLEDRFLCDVLCVGFERVIDDAFLSEYVNVKHIVCPCTGSDHIDISSDVNIIKLIPSEINDIPASSEFALLMVLAILRKFNAVLTYSNIQVGEDLMDKTVGLLGHGRIGKRLEGYLKALGANVIWHDIKEDGLSKEDVLRRSDVVVLLVSATPENRNYISKEDFDKMDRCPYFVNVSRGFIVNDQDLLSALQDGAIKGAALDVVDDEVVFCDYLRANMNLIITPHTAGSTLQSRRKAIDFVFNKLKSID